MASFWGSSPGTRYTRAATNHRVRWWLVVGVGLLGVSVGLVAAGRAHEALAATEFSLSAWQARQTAKPAAQAQPADTRDFIQTLPGRFANDHLMSVIERARLDHGVVLGRIQIDPRPPEPGQLTSTDLSLTLKGTYPAIKAVLSELTARCPEVTLARLGLQRNAGTPEVEAVVSLRVWAKPVAVGSSTTTGAY